MLAIVPVNTMLDVPLAPLVKVKPVVLLRVTVPLAADNVIWLVVESTSETEMPLMVKFVSSLTDWAPAR